MMQEAVVLIIRRSWVRAPPAPPEVSLEVSVEPWTGGGATTLKHYADPVSEVDRRDAAYLAQLTTRSAARSG
jgi:hypothetical protein